MIQRATDAVYSEIIAANNAEFRTRQDDFVAQKGAVGRLFYRGLRFAVGLAPEELDQATSWIYARAGLEVIGKGMVSTVVRDGDQVLKVVRKSVRASESEREALWRKLCSRQAPVLNYLGDFAVAQDFTIGQHPARPGNRAVLSRQPFLQGYVPLDFDNLASYPRRARWQLAAFASGAIAMYDATGMHADLVGVDNLGFSTYGEGKLQLVDTVGFPDSIADDRCRNLIAQQLHAMSLSFSDRTIL